VRVGDLEAAVRAAQAAAAHEQRRRAAAEEELGELQALQATEKEEASAAAVDPQAEPLRAAVQPC
jgi:hypothetical protein